MRILQICNKIPFPPTDGGTIAMNNLTQGFLAEGHEVKVLAINTPKQKDKVYLVPEDYKERTSFEAIFIDTSIKPFPAVFNLFTGKSYNISRFYLKDFEAHLVQILLKNEFDIIQLESLFVTPYLEAIRKNSKAKVVLRAHNVEYKIWERLADKQKDPKSVYLKLLAKRLKKYEKNHLNKFDAIAAITKVDVKEFENLGCNIPTIDIPFGIDKTESLTKGKTNDDAFHLGSMDWMPNTEGVLWFLRYVWPQIEKQFPNKKLFLAGKKMPDKIRAYKKQNVIIEGEITTPFQYMENKGIMVVPLLSGGGMRVKIIEGMAVGKTVVSTSIGAEGIEYEHKKNILIADTPQEFVEMLSLCYSNPSLIKSIGEEAKNLVNEKYNNRKITQKLLSFYQSLLN